MTPWTCAISGCMASFDDPETLLAHQGADHDPHRCRICDELLPAGFYAIRHVVHDHTRAEYVRHYDADSDDIRERESVVERVEDLVDVESLRRRLDRVDGEGARVEAVE
ncbi:MAG: hypothetical protein ABEJ55_04080 [Halanaeroarchaeum sp.]